MVLLPAMSSAKYSERTWSENSLSLVHHYLVHALYERGRVVSQLRKIQGVVHVHDNRYSAFALLSGCQRLNANMNSGTHSKM